MFFWQRLHDENVNIRDAAYITKKIDVICNSWVNTPYMPGQRCKNVGVDCVQFICGVLDELNNRPCGSTEISRLSQDTGANDHDGMHGAIIAKQIMKLNPAKRLDVFCLQPGDLVVCKLGRYGGGGHTMIVSGQKNVLYHACNVERKVTKRGFGSIKNGLHAYRFLNRNNWASERV